MSESLAFVSLVIIASVQMMIMLKYFADCDYVRFLSKVMFCRDNFDTSITCLWGDTRRKMDTERYRTFITANGKTRYINAFVLFWSAFLISTPAAQEEQSFIRTIKCLHQQQPSRITNIYKYMGGYWIPWTFMGGLLEYIGYLPQPRPLGVDIQERCRWRQGFRRCLWEVARLLQAGLEWPLLPNCWRLGSRLDVGNLEIIWNYVM